MYNDRSLDQLKQFAEFLEFMSDTTAAKKRLVDLQKATAEYNSAANAIREAKDFQTWRNEQLAKLEKKEESLKKNTDDVEALLKKNEQYFAAENEKLSAREQEVLVKEKEVETRLATLTKVNEEREELEKSKEAFYTRQEKFAQQVAAFEEKKKALDALMKG